MIRQLAENIGKGIVAGLAGTAAMTVASTLEMKVRDRGASTTPADAVAKVFDVEATNEKAKMQWSNVIHWTYGTAWGVARGALDSMGLKGPMASAAHFALVWPAALVMLPSLDVTPPPNEWGGEELALDALHHAVYALAVGAVYDALDGNS